MPLIPLEEVLENLDKINEWCHDKSWASYESFKDALDLGGNCDLMAKCLRWGENFRGEPFIYDKKRELRYKVYLARFELIQHLYELEQEEEKEKVE